MSDWGKYSRNCKFFGIQEMGVWKVSTEKISYRLCVKLHGKLVLCLLKIVAITNIEGIVITYFYS